MLSDTRFTCTGDSATLDTPGRFTHIVDWFATRTPAGEWIAVLDEQGCPRLMPAGDDSVVPESLRQELARHKSVCKRTAPTLDMESLLLLGITEMTPARPDGGLEAPLQLTGYLSGPYLSGASPRRQRAEITLPQRAVMGALLLGAQRPFHYPSGENATAIAERSFPLVFAGGTDTDTLLRRHVVFAYPALQSQRAVEKQLGETGNEWILRQLAYDLLLGAQRESTARNAASPLSGVTLPVPNRMAALQEMKAAGFQIDGDSILPPPAKGAGAVGRWLHRTFGRRMPLPEQGRMEDYFSWMEALLRAQDDWPSSEWGILNTLDAAWRVSWTQGQAAGLGPVHAADGVFHIDEGILESASPSPGEPRHLYFTVDRGFAASLSGPAELAIEFMDTGGGTIAVEYDGQERAYTQAPPSHFNGTESWKTVHIRLEHPRFDGRQTGGADLRICPGPRDIRIRAVQLIRTT